MVYLHNFKNHNTSHFSHDSDIANICSWERTKHLYTCVHDSATCVGSYMCGQHMCGWLHAWSATCVVSHVWLATCVVSYMRGPLHVWLVTCGWLHVWSATCVVSQSMSITPNILIQSSVKSPNGFGVSVQVSIENSNKPYYTPYSE